MLYKGIDQARIRGLFDETGAVSDLSVLLSNPPGDFNSRQTSFYFTPDVHVAEFYARYAKRRGTAESVVIVSLPVPNAAIEMLSEPEIRHLRWPDDKWKELVWHCRTNRKLPIHLRSYRDATLIIGTIARRPNFMYRQLEEWQDITEDFLLKVDGREATQYVISGFEKGEMGLRTR